MTIMVTFFVDMGRFNGVPADLIMINTSILKYNLIVQG